MRKSNWVCEYFHATTLYECPKCGKKLRDFQAELQAKVDAVPFDRKVAFLRFLKEGRFVKEAIDLADPNGDFETIVWYNIIKNQIESHEYKTFNFNAK